MAKREKVQQNDFYLRNISAQYVSHPGDSGHIAGVCNFLQLCYRVCL